MAKKLKDLPIGSTFILPNAKYLDDAKEIVHMIIAKNHTGYPSNSVTAITEDIIMTKEFDSVEPNNKYPASAFGNSRYKYSNIHQFLNATDRDWYRATHSTDEPPSYIDEEGYLANYPKEFIKEILSTNRETKVSEPYGGGYDSYSAKVFLLSDMELFGDGSDDKQNHIKYFDSRDKRRAPEEYYTSTATQGTNSKEINGVQNSGNSYIGYPVEKSGIRPTFNLSEELSVSDHPNKDGHYIILLNEEPVIHTTMSSDMGQFTKPFQLKYTVTDKEGDKVRVVEKLNNATLRTIDNITLGEQQTIEITESQWRALPTNEQSTITITADDGQGVTTKTFTFVKRNDAPLVTLDTKDNEIFYEGSTLNISGTATDVDVGDAVIVKYNLASSRERVITTQVSTGESFGYGKVLTFTKGRFFDGETVVTDVLAEGNTYTLEVWAQDDKGVNSPIQKRKFTVVPNRSPLLEITETPNEEGAALSTDLSIKGTVNDPDGDDVRLTYKLNNGKEIPIAESDGVFEVNFRLSDLKQGRNTFLVIARDEYDSMITREVQVTTTAVKSSTEHIENKLYYTIDTKGVEADGILVWLRRPIGDDTDYKGYLSITQTGAVEDYQAMDKTTSIVQGHKRDELIGSVGEKGADVRLKLEFDGDEAPIQMLQGVIK